MLHNSMFSENSLFGNYIMCRHIINLSSVVIHSSNVKARQED